MSQFGTFRTCRGSLTMFAPEALVLQKSKVAAVQIFGENLKRKEVMIRIVSVALPKSPTNLAQGDEVSLRSSHE